MDWLPKLAPSLSLHIPQPVAQGQPGSGYPFPWAIYRWMDDRRLNYVKDEISGRTFIVRRDLDNWNTVGSDLDAEATSVF